MDDVRCTATLLAPITRFQQKAKMVGWSLVRSNHLAVINDSTHRQLFAKILGEVYLEVQLLSECIPSRLHHQPQHAIIFKKRLTSLWPVTTLAILSMRLPYFFPLALIRSKNLSFFQEGLHVIQYPSHSGVPKHFPGLLGCLEIEHAVTDRDKKQHSLVALSATKSLDAPCWCSVLRIKFLKRI